MVVRDVFTSQFSAGCQSTHVELVSGILPNGVRGLFATLVFAAFATHITPAAADEIELQVLHAFEGGFSTRTPSGGWPRAGLTQGLDGTLYGTTATGGEFGHGTVYKLGPDGHAQTLHSFRGVGIDGVVPYEELTLGGDGALYGSTDGEGYSKTNGSTIFKIDGAGNFRTLYTFNTAKEGSSPNELMLASDGTIYGTLKYNDRGPLRFGGTGSLFALKPNGELKILYQARVSGPWAPSGALIEGMDKALYGTFKQGSTDGASTGAVYRIGRDHKLTILHEFSRTGAAGDYPELGVVQAPDGALYGLTSYGGLNGTGAFFKMNTDGSGFEMLAANPPARDSNPNKLMLAKDGNFYATHPVASTGEYGWIYKYSPTGAYTLLKTFHASELDVLGNAPQGRLLQASDGYFYGVTYADGAYGNGTIYRFLPPAGNALR